MGFPVATSILFISKSEIFSKILIIALMLLPCAAIKIFFPPSNFEYRISLQKPSTLTRVSFNDSPLGKSLSFIFSKIGSDLSLFHLFSFNKGGFVK